MGIIQRQTFKNNILAYASVIIGAVASIWIYPDDLALKGYADALLKWALICVPFVALGTSTVSIRIFPYLRGEPKYVGGQLLLRSLTVVTIALSLLSFVNFFCGESIVAFFVARSYEVGKLETSRWEIISLLAALVYASVLTAHLVNFKRIAIPVVFNNLLMKIGLPSLMLLVTYGYLSTSGFSSGLLILYWLGVLGLLIYAIVIGVFKLKWGEFNLEGKNMSEVYSLAAFSVFSSIGSVLATHLDTVAVNSLIGDTETGVYGFAVFCTMVIAIPYRAVNAIAAPIVSRTWKERDVPQLAFLYRESSSVLFAVGALIYSGTLVCLPFVYQVTEKTGQYAVGFTSVVLLGLGQLFDQVASINSVLIAYSDYFRWNVVFILFMGVLNVILNYYFIGTLELGISGAAAATAISLLLFNLVKGLFIYWKMNIHPFSSSALWTIAVMIPSLAIAHFLPLPEGVLLNILIRGGLIVVAFYLYFRYTNGVPAINRMLKDGVKSMF